MKGGAIDHSPRGARDGDDWVERVRAASDIVELIGQTVALKRVGRNWVGLCPFHQEKTPSFSVNPERQFYHCFSCKAGGDVFRYVQETERVGFIEAVELLSRRAGIAVPERRSEGGRVRRPLLEALEAAASAYEQWLADPREGEAARRYLDERGVTPETIRTYRLGLAPDGWEHLSRRLGERFGVDALIEAGLAARRDTGRGVYDRFRNRLMVPLVAPGGEVLGFGARALQAGQEPKYLNSAESAVYHKRSFLFGYEQARRATSRDGELILVEGYFDVIAMHQAGIRNVAATSGTALTPEHAKLLQRLVASVVLTFDGDAAGQDAMMRSLGTLLAAGLEVRVAELPEGEDPDVLIRRRGAVAWEAVRERALDPVDFIQKHGFKRAGPGDPKERALQMIVELAKEIADPVRLRLFLERSERVLEVPEGVLARAVGLRRAGQRSEAPVQAAVRVQRRGDAHVERQLLQALRMAPEHLDAVRPLLAPEDFLDPACRDLARAMWEESGSATPEAESLDRELTASAEDGMDWGAMVAGALQRMRVRRLDRQRREVQQELMRVQRDRPGETSGMQDLMTQYQRLTEEIRTLDRAEQVTRGGDVLPPH
jgi:DNA primase